MNTLFYILVISLLLQVLGAFMIYKGKDSKDPLAVKRGLKAIISSSVLLLFVILSQVYLIYFITQVAV